MILDIIITTDYINLINLSLGNVERVTPPIHSGGSIDVDIIIKLCQKYLCIIFCPCSVCYYDMCVHPCDNIMQCFHSIRHTAQQQKHNREYNYGNKLKEDFKVISRRCHLVISITYNYTFTNSCLFNFYLVWTRIDF